MTNATPPAVLSDEELREMVEEYETTREVILFANTHETIATLAAEVLALRAIAGDCVAALENAGSVLLKPTPLVRVRLEAVEEIQTVLTRARALAEPAKEARDV